MMRTTSHNGILVAKAIFQKAALVRAMVCLALQIMNFTYLYRRTLAMALATSLSFGFTLN